MERDVDLRGFGGTTFRREAKERGLEPDECYKLGKLEEDGVPDIAIENNDAKATCRQIRTVNEDCVNSLLAVNPDRTKNKHSGGRRLRMSHSTLAALVVAWTAIGSCSGGSTSWCAGQFDLSEIKRKNAPEEAFTCPTGTEAAEEPWGGIGMPGWERYCVQGSKRQGPFTVYRALKVFTQGQYANGERDGTWYTFDESGHLIHTTIYEHGSVVQELEGGPSNVN